MALSRHAQRQLAFQTLYSLFFSPANNMDELKERFQFTPVEQSPEKPAAQDKAEPAPEAENDSAPKKKRKNAAKEEAAEAPAPEPLRQASGLAWELVRGVWENGTVIDKLITEVANRGMERIGRIEQVILRMASYEMMTTKADELKIILSEAVILSNEFGDERSRQFINGILNGISRRVLDEKLTLPHSRRTV